MVACSWSNKFYLLSLQGYKLIEVELKHTLTKILAVPFMFNHLNFLVLIATGEVVRIGIESYGQGLGAELNSIKTCLSNDCVLGHDKTPKYQIYSCEGHCIHRVSYLNEAKHHFLEESSGRIMKVSCSKEGFAYLLDLDHSIELKFL